MPLSGGDWAQLNRDIEALNNRLEGVRIWILHRLSTDVVSDLEKKEQYKIQQIKVKKHIDELHQIRSEALRIINKINIGLSSLQHSKIGGHLEDWQEKRNQVQSIVNTIDQYIITEKQYL